MTTKFEFVQTPDDDAPAAPYCIITIVGTASMPMPYFMESIAELSRKIVAVVEAGGWEVVEPLKLKKGP